MEHLQTRARRPAAMALLFAASTSVLGWAGVRPASADVSSVTASAFGYYTNVGFFGGPAGIRGFGQTTPPGTAQSASPSVECPSTGSGRSRAPMVVTDADGAKAQYGPAALFSGRWPDLLSARPRGAEPPSGALTVTCQGTTGPNGFASSSAEVFDVGPGPLTAAEVYSTCSATEAGGLTGTTKIVGGILETSYDPVTQLPVVTEPIPLNPAVGYESSGRLEHIGDNYRIVFNEQIVNPDGTLTVNAAHMYLLGPVAAIGDLIVGSSTCGVAVVAAPPDPHDPHHPHDPHDHHGRSGHHPV